MKRWLAAIGCLGACGGSDDPDIDPVAVHAPAQALALFEGGVWTAVATDAAGDAVIYPTGRFALAGLCTESPGSQAPVFVVMAGPDDGDSFVLPCPSPSSARATLDVEVAGAGIATLYFGPGDGDTTTVTDRATVAVPAGRRDVVARQRNGDDSFTFVIVRDLELAVGEQHSLVIDFAQRAPMKSQIVDGDPRYVQFELTTANHTVVDLPARYDDAPTTTRVFAPAALVAGDRQLVTSMTPLDAPVTRTTMARIRADLDGADGLAVHAPTTERLGAATITHGGSRLDATWTSPETWPTQHVFTYSTAVWDVAVSAGWSGTAAAGSLSTPDLTGHPQWDERFAIVPASQGVGTLELYRPLDVDHEVGVGANVPTN